MHVFVWNTSKIGKNTNRFLKNPAKRPKLYLTTPPKTKFYRDVYSFSSKCGWSKNIKNQKLKNLKIHVYKTNKTSTQSRKKTNRFSKNLIKQTGFLPYNTPLKCTYPGTFIQIPQKVAGDFFETSQNLKNLKIPKIKNPKIRKSKNPKIRKSENPKIRKSENPTNVR